MNKIKELEKVWLEKTLVKRAVEDRRREREYVLLAEVHAKLNAEFGAELEAARKTENEAKVALSAEENRVREDVTLSKLPYPLGTVLAEWSYGSSTWTPNNLKKTTNKAVLQVFKQGDPLPANVRYNRPSVGSLVLRLLKKDGTTGAAVEQWNPVYEKCWLPEGVEPKQKTE